MTEKKDFCSDGRGMEGSTNGMIAIPVVSKPPRSVINAVVREALSDEQHSSGRNSPAGMNIHHQK